ncbi:MAG: peptidase inhibitor family I36 protein [Bauldia sp.]|nr:peptidase inhibitor family I36 protein [Bauldia sp.]
MQRKSKVLLAGVLLAGASVTAASAQLLNLGDSGVGEILDLSDLLDLDLDSDDADDIDVDLDLNDGDLGAALDLNLFNDTDVDGVVDLNLNNGVRGMVGLGVNDPNADGDVIIDVNALGGGGDSGASVIISVELLNRLLNGGGDDDDDGDGDGDGDPPGGDDPDGNGVGGGGGGIRVAQAGGGGGSGDAQVCLFAGANFEGDGVCGGAGDEAPDLPDSWDNRISSIRISGGLSVEVCGDDNYSGWCVEYTASVAQLPAGQDNDISSFRIY